MFDAACLAVGCAGAPSEVARAGRPTSAARPRPHESAALLSARLEETPGLYNQTGAPA